MQRRQSQSAHTFLEPSLQEILSTGDNDLPLPCAKRVRRNDSIPMPPSPEVQQHPPLTRTNSMVQVPAVVQNLVNNELSISKSRTWTKVLDPSTQRFLARVPDSTQIDVQNAVNAALTAQPAWAAQSVSRRKACLLSLLNLLHQNAAAIKLSLQTEVGKTARDAESEFERGVDAVDTACSVSAQIHGTHWNTQSADTYTVYEPLGICVSITPFNFPFMIPLWSIPNALITGNCVILKPSEKAPLTANILGDCFVKAGFPPGVFNIIHGSAGTVDKLLAQPAVNVVSFVGSEIVGERVYEHAKATRKRVQVESSGKNHGVVLDDAVKGQTLYAIAGSAFGSAGQRCMALSVLICVGETKEWLNELATVARSLKVGCGLDPNTEIGPLITPIAKERVEATIDIAEAEGAEILLDGRNYSVPGYPEGNFVGPTIISKVKPYMQCYQEELFGPVLVCLEVETLEEAIEAINENKYGNGCTLFTTNPSSAQNFQRKVNVGQVGINIPVLAPSGPIPRTTNKDSFLGDGLCGRNSWQFFTMVKTITSLWRQ